MFHYLSILMGWVSLNNSIWQTVLWTVILKFNEDSVLGFCVGVCVCVCVCVRACVRVCVCVFNFEIIHGLAFKL
jgi:hypothetical protein